MTYTSEFTPEPTDEGIKRYWAIIRALNENRGWRGDIKLLDKNTIDTIE